MTAWTIPSRLGWIDTILPYGHAYCCSFCSATSTANLPPDSFFLLCRSDWSRLRHSIFTCVFFANLITYASSLFSFIKKNYLFHSNTGTVSSEIPTPLNLFISLWSSRGALTLFSGQTRPFCMGTPGQCCSDASRLVLQGGILRWYYICTIITCRHVSLTHCACLLVESPGYSWLCESRILNFPWTPCSWSPSDESNKNPW